MSTAPIDQRAALDPGRASWKEVASIAAGTDTLTGQVEVLADALATVLATIDESNGVLPTVRVDISRELSAASARLSHAAARLQVASVGLVDHEDVHLYDAERTTRKWLARHGGLSHQAASALCRTAATAERFPEVGSAFQAGRFTAGHLDAVGNIIPSRFKGADCAAAIEKVLAIQHILVTTAEQSTVDEFVEFCDRVRDRLDADGRKPREAEASRIWLHRLFNGRWALTGDLSADDGALIATILADIRARRTRSDATPEPAPAADNEQVPDEAAPTLSELTARDVVDLLTSGSGSDRPGRVGIFLHIDLDDLNAPDDLDQLVTDRRTAHTEAGYDISDDALWGLMADSDVTPVFNRNGTSLWYGRTRRLAPPMLRRVIAHRDRRCRFPGCDRPPIWNEAHHVVHWDHGGTTDPATCAGTCSFHHHLHHDSGFGIEGDATGVLEFTRPDGSMLDVNPHYLRHACRKAS